VCRTAARDRLVAAGLPRDADGVAQQPLGEGKVAVLGSGLAKGVEHVGHIGIVGAFGRYEQAQRVPAQADSPRQPTAGMGGDGPGSRPSPVQGVMPTTGEGLRSLRRPSGRGGPADDPQLCPAWRRGNRRIPEIRGRSMDFTGPATAGRTTADPARVVP
jgi:hypothetical protein